MGTKDKYGDKNANQGYANNENTNNPGEMLNNYFGEMKNLQEDDMMMVDNAWDKVFTRLKNDNLLEDGETGGNRFSITWMVRIAAMVIIAIGLTFTGRYVVSNKLLSPKIAVSTSAGEKNKLVELADGSTIYLNSNSTLTYPKSFSAKSRNVKLSGEAFFDIAPDADKPFIIDAGKASIKVVGTSFNIMTDNGRNEVEVLVKTGTVILSSSNGEKHLTLEPGDLGTMNNSTSSQTVNNDPNYLSWNTDVLVYDGAKLEKTFADLKRVHDINIVANDKSILDKRISTIFDHQDPDTIVTMICRTFNLGYEKSGGVYYISGK